MCVYVYLYTDRTKVCDTPSTYEYLRVGVVGQGTMAYPQVGDGESEQASIK